MKILDTSEFLDGSVCQSLAQVRRDVVTLPRQTASDAVFIDIEETEAAHESHLSAVYFEAYD